MLWRRWSAGVPCDCLSSRRGSPTTGRPGFVEGQILPGSGVNLPQATGASDAVGQRRPASWGGVFSGRQSTPFRLELADFRTRFPRISSCTAAISITDRPRTFSRRPAPAFPAPSHAPARLPARPPLPGRMPSYHRMSTHVRARGRVITRHRTAPATGRRSRINTPTRTCAAPSIIVLRAMHVYSLGVHRKVYYRHVLHIPAATGFHSKRNTE